jgi:hypothetical protein
MTPARARNRSSRLVAAFACCLLAGFASADAAKQRLGLSPHSAELFNNASISPTGYAGSLVLPPGGTPGFSLGFTLPEDYEEGTKPAIEVTVDSEATGCNFTIRGRALMRGRAGQPADLGSVNGGLVAVSASTPFTVSDGGQNLTFAAPSTAFTGARFQFRIEPTPGEFGELRPGDAVVFTLVRFNDVGDTCDDRDLHVGGVAISYTLRPPAQLPGQARLSLDPFSAFSEDADPIVWNGVEPPVRLENSATRNDAAFAFVIPEDHRRKTPLVAELLWSAGATGCDFVLSPNFIFRSRAGRARDHALPTSSVVDGLTALDATTAFVLAGDDLRVAAPAAAQSVERIRFRIGGGGGFPALRAGDAISFGIFRRQSAAADTCTVDLAVLGVSIVYERDPEARTAAAEAAGERRLSLNPYGFAGTVEIIGSGFEPAASFRGGTISSSFHGGFVVPNDYFKNSPLTVAMLVSAAETGCEFRLLANSLFRARPKHRRDFGNAAGGLAPKGATTPATVSSNAIQFAAPATPGRTERVEFEVTPTPGEFPSLKAGDAINVSIFRAPGQGGDTCVGPLGLAGVSIVYTTEP